MQASQVPANQQHPAKHLNSLVILATFWQNSTQFLVSPSQLLPINLPCNYLVGVVDDVNGETTSSATEQPHARLRVLHGVVDLLSGSVQDCVLVVLLPTRERFKIGNLTAKTISLQEITQDRCSFKLTFYQVDHLANLEAVYLAEVLQTRRHTWNWSRSGHPYHHCFRQK